MSYGPLAIRVEREFNISKRTVYRWIKRGISPDEIRKIIIDNKDGLYNANEVANIFSVTVSTIYRWYYEGLIPGIQIFRTIRFNKSIINKIANCKINNKEE